MFKSGIPWSTVDKSDSVKAKRYTYPSIGNEAATEQMITNTEDKRSKTSNQLDHMLSPGSITSALRSVTLFHMWGHGESNLQISELFSVPHPNDKDSSALPQEEHKEGSSDLLNKDTPDISFDSKYIRGCPLYQDYCLGTVKVDLQKTNQRSLSELLTPQCLPGLQTPHHSCPDASPPKPALKVTPCTLWQDLPEVREHGLLTSLTLWEIRLQEAKFEMIVSEASYLKSLGVAINHFSASKTLRQTLSKMEHHILFSNLCDVGAASEKFLLDLEVRLGENVMISQVGDIVLRHCPEFRSLYVPYVINMMYQEALLKRLMQKNSAFMLAVTKLESDSVCQRQRLKSFLALPFQRITRFKIIMESILKLTERNSKSNPHLKEAIEAIHKIVSECNEGIQRMKQIEELVCLEKLVDFSNVKSIPLIVSGRYLVHKGSLRQQTLGTTLGNKITFRDVYIHLFNDLLLISLKKGLRFNVLHQAVFPTHVHTEIFKTEGLGLPPESFLLRLSQHHFGDAVALILVPHTRSDQETWMKALTIQNVNSDTHL